MLSRSVLLRMRNVSDKSCRGNHNTHFVFSNALPKIVWFMRYCGKFCYSRRGHRWQCNMAHAHRMLHKQGYKHILRICNTCINCFCTTVVNCTRLNVCLYVTLPVLCSASSILRIPYLVWCGRICLAATCVQTGTCNIRKCLAKNVSILQK